MRISKFTENFVTLINQSQRTVRTIVKDPDRINKLHPSSFPYCPLRHAYEKVSGKVETQDFNFSSDLYMRMGTLVHKIFQDWTGKAAFELGKNKDFEIEILGNWRCPKCKAIRRLKPYKKCVCGSEMKYSEIPVEWDPISGHIDIVLRYKRWCVPVDYKTISSLRLLSHRSNPAASPLPEKSHKDQVEAYSVLFERQYGKELKGCTVLGWILFYISRDDPLHINQPFCYQLSEHDKSNIRKRLKRYRKHFKLAFAAKKVSDFKELVKVKPCADHTYYMNNFHSPYSPCPLGISGACFDKKRLANRIKKAVKESK